jgi:hypothetical protein
LHAGFNSSGSTCGDSCSLSVRQLPCVLVTWCEICDQETLDHIRPFSPYVCPVLRTQIQPGVLVACQDMCYVLRTHLKDVLAHLDAKKFGGHVDGCALHLSTKAADISSFLLSIKGYQQFSSSMTTSRTCVLWHTRTWIAVQ